VLLLFIHFVVLLNVRFYVSLIYSVALLLGSLENLNREDTTDLKELMIKIKANRLM
jgi:hypothetical protein